MPDPLAVRSYYGILITITTKAKLMDRIIAAYAALGQTIPALSGAQVIIRATVGNANAILIGDASLSTTVYGRSLAASTATYDSIAKYGPFSGTVPVPLDSMYVISSDGSTSVTATVEILRG